MARPALVGGSEIGVRAGASEERAWQCSVCRAKVQLWGQEGLGSDPHPPCLGGEHPLTPTSCQAQLDHQPLLHPHL